MIALSTGSLYNYSTARVFDMAAEIGYDGIEVLIDGRWDTRDPVYLSRLTSHYDLPIVALHSPFVPDVHGWPTDKLKRLEQTIALANHLKVHVVVEHLPFRIYGIWGQMNFLGNKRFMLPLPVRKRDKYYHFLRKNNLSSMEMRSCVKVALENMPARKFLGLTFNPYWFNSLDSITRFPHLTMDTTHLGTWGLDPVNVYKLLEDRVVHLHLSNYDGSEHRSPVDGHLPLAELLRHMSNNRYSGVISVEASPDALQAEDEKMCREALGKALNFCRDNFI
jgi:sugar phosphate isomerase/epimerase